MPAFSPPYATPYTPDDVRAIGQAARRHGARALLGGGAGLGIVAALALALVTWVRCADLGPRVEVHPAIRALDAGAR